MLRAFFPSSFLPVCCLLSAVAVRSMGKKKRPFRGAISVGCGG